MKGISMKSCIRGLSLFGLATLTLVSLTACESGEDRSLSSAQACLDGATDAAQAQVCVDKVAGLETQDAYLIRCSAAFIANGFTGQKIADAYTSISGGSSNSSGYDPMVSIMAYLNFSSSNENFKAATAVNNCQRSGVKSMYQLASAAELSSTLAQLTTISAQFDPQNPEESLQDIINNINDGTFAPTNDQLTALGNVATTVNTAFCDNATNPNKDVCSKLQTAIVDAGMNGGTPADLATALLALLPPPH